MHDELCAMKEDLRKHNKAVFFDLYGTLLVYGDMKRAWEDWLIAFHSRLVPFGLSLSLDSLSRECDGFLEKAPTGEREHLTPFENRIVCLCERIGLRLSIDAVASIADQVAGAWEEHVRVDSDASEVLIALRKEKSLALVSNFDHPRHLRKVIATHRLTPLFRSIVISGEFGVKKPDPRIFRQALKETGLSPREVVYVGDTEEDVEGARAAGITPVLIRRFDNRIDRAALDFASDTITASDHGRQSMLDVTTIASLKELLTLLL